MLDRFEKEKAILSCEFCSEEYGADIASISSEFNEEWGEYRNPSMECPNCGALEFINVNLPEVPDDVPYDRLDPKERKQRGNVQKFIMMVREDYVRPTKANKEETRNDGHAD